MITTFHGVYRIIDCWMTLTLFQGHRCVRTLYWKLCIWDCCPLYNGCMVGTHILKYMHTLCECVYFGRVASTFFSFLSMSLHFLHFNASHLECKCCSCFMYQSLTLFWWHSRNGAGILQLCVWWNEEKKKKKEVNNGLGLSVLCVCALICMQLFICACECVCVCMHVCTKECTHNVKEYLWGAYT